MENEKKEGNGDAEMKGEEEGEGERGKSGKYVAATLKLTQNTTLDEILELTRDPHDEKEEKEEKERKDGMEKLFKGNNFLLTGLHCCGGLSPTVLRMFGSNNTKNNNNNNNWTIKGVFLLSCCYHLVQEKEDLLRKRNKAEKAIEGSDKKEKEEVEDGKEVENGKDEEEEVEKEGEEERIDFPMSKFVANSGICLGRSARLLGCYGIF